MMDPESHAESTTRGLMMQVCSIAPSQSDNRKLYVNSGADVVVKLRAESK